MEQERDIENEIETMPTDDGKLPTVSLISHNGRSKLESEILAIAETNDVQAALKDYLIETGKNDPSITGCTIREAAGKGGEALKQAFDEGVRKLLEISGDHRLEVTHWMVGKLQEEEAGMDVVEFFFTEAKNQFLEAEEDEAVEVERFFGSQ